MRRSIFPAVVTLFCVSAARGTIAKDKDFGSGYRYQVIIEKGALKR